MDGFPVLKLTYTKKADMDGFPVLKLTNTKKADIDGFPVLKLTNTKKADIDGCPVLRPYTQRKGILRTRRPQSSPPIPGQCRADRRYGCQLPISVGVTSSAIVRAETSKALSPL